MKARVSRLLLEYLGSIGDAASCLEQLVLVLRFSAVMVGWLLLVT